MIVVTGASGQLGRLVIAGLLEKVAAAQLVAVVRDAASVSDFAARGVRVRVADYNAPATLDAAFAGAERLLLISSNDVGRRVPQHRAVIDAAKRAGVQLVAYTSLLHAATSTLPLAAEHKETEALLQASTLPHVVLRNGWYTENYTANAPAALQTGAIVGSAGDGHIASAARADYAAAAVAVLTQAGHAGRIYELAGDTAYTLAELAAEIGAQSGKAIVYRHMQEAEFASALAAAGLPAGFAAMLAACEVAAAQGELFDDRRQLSALIGRPTTPLRTLVRAALPETVIA